MPNILSKNHNNNSFKNVISILQTELDKIDKTAKIGIVSLFLLILATPLIVSNTQTIHNFADTTSPQSHSYSLSNKIGAYDIGVFYKNTERSNEKEVQLAHTLGISYSIRSYVSSESAMYAVLKRNHMKYVDGTLLGKINYYLQIACPIPTSAKTNKPISVRHDPTCQITGDNLQLLLRDVQQYVTSPKIENDQAILGFYLQDDNIGNTKNVLPLIHQIIQNANRTSVLHRSTLCAFGAGLDYYNANGVFTRYSRHNLALSVSNFSPDACDYVSFYPYGVYSWVNGDASKIDWSMKQLLPDFKAQLSLLGWDQNMEPLIGIPQTFYYPDLTIANSILPRAIDISTQIQSFCGSGAVGILPYAFDDSSTEVGKIELGNANSMQAGFLDGTSKCNSDWVKQGSKLVSVKITSSTPLITSLNAGTCYEASVTDQYGNHPAGDIVFKDNASILGFRTLKMGQTQTLLCTSAIPDLLTFDPLISGSESVIAEYIDTTQARQTTSSLPIVLTIAKDPTSTAINASAGPKGTDACPLATVRVQNYGGPIAPNGHIHITIQDNQGIVHTNVASISAQVINGHASFPLPLVNGLNYISAPFVDDVNYYYKGSAGYTKTYLNYGVATGCSASESGNIR